MKVTVKQLKQLIREQVEEISSDRMNPRTGLPFPDRMSDDEVDFHLAQQARTRKQREKDPSFCDGHGTHEFRGRPGERTCQICGSAAPDNIKEQVEEAHDDYSGSREERENLHGRRDKVGRTIIKYEYSLPHRKAIKKKLMEEYPELCRTLELHEPGIIMNQVADNTLSGAKLGLLYALEQREATK